MSLETTLAVPHIKRIRKPAASKPRTEAQQKAYEKMVAKRKELIEQRKKLKEPSLSQSLPNDIPPPESSDDDEYDSNNEETSHYSEELEEPEEPKISKKKAKQAILKLLLQSESDSEGDTSPYPLGSKGSKAPLPHASVFAEEYYDHDDYYPREESQPMRKPPQVRKEHNLRNRMSRIQQQQLYRHQQMNQEPSVTIFQ